MQREESLQIAAWARHLGDPAREARSSRVRAHLGSLAAISALVAYLIWRVAFTLPGGTWNRTVAWLLVAFEFLPLIGLALKTVTLWSIDGHGPVLRSQLAPDARVTVLIPTYDEPVEVVAPTIAAACNLEPRHDTWVLDDGNRPWLAELCASYGARYVTREEHVYAKAGNLNNALTILADEEAAGTGGADIIAVLDCDHVPLPTFLSATLGWFADPKVALVQGPQAFYNQGAFDDDGYTGEQGLFFNVVMPAQGHAGAAPFWCGSTALLRVSALREIGGIATTTITEDMHTTLRLIRAGWKTRYHHQTLAVGLAPETAEQYLLQRRRWGLGAMQILVEERLLSAKRWMSWRTYHEYLSATLWWLEGLGSVATFLVPVAIMVSGARTTTVSASTYALAFVSMFTVRLIGVKYMLRREIRWPTAFALRILRIPVGLSCARWLLTRSSLAFRVTPKGGAAARERGRAPRVLWVLTALALGIAAYATAGVAGLVPWRTPAASTVASGLWILLAGAVLVLGLTRISSRRFASTRRNAPRIAFSAPVRLEGIDGELIDVSVGGAAVRLAEKMASPPGLVVLELPGGCAVKMEIVRHPRRHAPGTLLSLRVAETSWEDYRSLALWLFHTPVGAIPELGANVPVVAATRVVGPPRGGVAPLVDAPDEARPAPLAASA